MSLCLLLVTNLTDTNKPINLVSLCLLLVRNLTDTNKPINLVSLCLLLVRNLTDTNKPINLVSLCLLLVRNLTDTNKPINLVSLCLLLVRNLTDTNKPINLMSLCLSQNVPHRGPPIYLRNLRTQVFLQVPAAGASANPHWREALQMSCVRRLFCSKGCSEAAPQVSPG